MIGGAPPADVNHLEAAAREVDLFLYHSRWTTPNASTSTDVRQGVTLREFEPVVRSRRGHLAFVFRGLHRALDHDRRDVVHVVSEPWGLLSVQAAAWVRSRSGARLVLHGCDTIWHHDGRIERAGRPVLLTRTLPRTDAWVAESNKALELAERNGLPPTSLRARIHTNPRNGGLFRPPDNAERAAARATLGVPDDRITVGLIGRLVPAKGVRLLLDAAELLLSEGFPGYFVIAGDGPLRDELRARTSDRVVALGRIVHPMGVLTLLHALDVIACPSVTTPSWEDQGPRSLLEAMRCGCVPVGTPTGAIGEMLGTRGVLAESTSARSLADAIATAADRSADPAGRGEIAAQARDRYSGDAVAAQLVELWREVAARRTDGPARTAAR